MEEIINKLDNILVELDKMNKRLETIETKLNIINDSTSNMDNHIHFVENVYDNIKQPLNYAVNKISYYMGSNSLENNTLPEITNSVNP